MKDFKAFFEAAGYAQSWLELARMAVPKINQEEDQEARRKHIENAKLWIATAEKHLEESDNP